MTERSVSDVVVVYSLSNGGVDRNADRVGGMMTFVPEDIAADLRERIEEIHRVNRLWKLMQDIHGPASSRAIQWRTLKDVLQLDLLQHYSPWVNAEADGTDVDGEPVLRIRVTVATGNRLDHACHIPSVKVAHLINPALFTQ